MGIQAGGKGLGSRDLANRPKRGIVWLVVFFTAFVAVSYLTRQRDQPAGNRPESAQQQDENDSEGSESERGESERSNTEHSETTTPDDSNREAAPQSSESDELGALEEIGRDVWRSPAGLLYKPGSAEGHRLKHLARHLEDDPSRPVHGVFLETMPSVIAWIDQAYRWSEENDRRVTVRQERGRTVVIARFDAPIGYVGGERGADDDYPRVRRLQLILEDQDVITAYPIE